MMRAKVSSVLYKEDDWLRPWVISQVDGQGLLLASHPIDSLWMAFYLLAHDGFVGFRKLFKHWAHTRVSQTDGAYIIDCIYVVYT